MLKCWPESRECHCGRFVVQRPPCGAKHLEAPGAMSDRLVSRCPAERINIEREMVKPGPLWSLAVEAILE